MTLRIFALLSIFLISPVCAGNNAGIFGKFLKTDAKINGEIVKLQPGADFERVSLKMRKAASKNAAWFREYSAKHPSGQPLPYHEKLGIAKEEHQKYLNAWKKRKFVVLAKVLLRLENPKKEEWRIRVSGPADTLMNLTYFPKQDLIKSPNGDLVRIDNIKTAKNSALGAWTGYEWRFSEKTSLGNTRENLALGKMADNKTGLLIYNMVESSLTRTILNDRFIIRFPLSK